MTEEVFMSGPIVFRNFVVAILMIVMFPILSAQNQDTEQTRKAIAMLNHLTVQTQLILDSKNNKLALEEMYDEFINNIAPSAVDTATQNELNIILDKINNFRLLETERKYIKILYENDQARAISSAMPDPAYFLSTVISRKPLEAIASVAMMGLSSWTNYNNATNDAKIKNLKANFNLDKQEIGAIHELRKGTFNYMIEMAAEFGLKDEETLNENSVSKFISLKLDNNPNSQKINLEGHQNIFSNYGPYWGLLAQTYYTLGEYQNCLNAVKKYEEVRAPIFRYDTDFANTLPYAILAVEKVYGNKSKTYFRETERYLKLLEKETPTSKWQMRYFIAQTYLAMAGQSRNNRAYLQEALKLARLDVVTLADIQVKLVEEYLQPVDTSIDPTLTKGEKKKREEEIKRNEELKSTSLIPYHEGFYQAWGLYVNIGAKLGVSNKEFVDTKMAILKALSIYLERYYITEKDFDDEFIWKYLEPYKDDLSIWKQQMVYNIFDFRLEFDTKIYSSDADYKELMAEIVDNISRDNYFSYYLPSLYTSSCYFIKPLLLGEPHIELIIPLCLLKENSEISYIIHEVSSGGNTKIFSDEDNVKFTRSVVSFEEEYEASYDSPVYFKWCLLQLHPNQELDFDKKKEYRIFIQILDEKLNTMLEYKNFHLKSERKSSLSNFMGVVDFD